MLMTVLKVSIAASVITFASWLSTKKPELAGFITALPLVSILALALSYTQSHDSSNAAQYARSIIFAVPVSWLFFVPFFFTERFSLGFWGSWISGLLLLAAGYFIHQWILKMV